MTTLRDTLTEAVDSTRSKGPVTGSEDIADAILAHPAMQAIAEKVALAEAVEGLLTQDITINPPHQVDEDGEWSEWLVWTKDTVGTGTTLLDALRAARGERS